MASNLSHTSHGATDRWIIVGYDEDGAPIKQKDHNWAMTLNSGEYAPKGNEEKSSNISALSFSSAQLSQPLNQVTYDYSRTTAPVILGREMMEDVEAAKKEWVMSATSEQDLEYTQE